MVLRRLKGNHSAKEGGTREEEEEEKRKGERGKEQKGEKGGKEGTRGKETGIEGMIEEWRGGKG